MLEAEKINAQGEFKNRETSNASVVFHEMKMKITYNEELYIIYIFILFIQITNLCFIFFLYFLAHCFEMNDHMLYANQKISLVLETDFH